MIKGMESWQRSTRESARRPARKEYLYLRSREKRVFFFIHQDRAFEPGNSYMPARKALSIPEGKDRILKGYSTKSPPPNAETIR
jgi:hypothetical protein